jgi:hypothetical protein
MKTLCLSLLAVVLTTGCRNLLPSDSNRSQTRWKSYEEAQAAFDKIKPHATTREELKEFGFDPKTTPNIKVLTYLDLIRRFLPNSSVTMADLHPDVRQCIEAKDACQVYELELAITHGKRYGNLFADMFGFKKKNHITGWDIKMLVLVKDDVVAYKLRSGEPHIDRYEKKVKPLGPFQDMEGVVSKMSMPF